MKIKPIRRTIKATALTSPDPSFVSQVTAGANQRPYRAVKMDAATVATPDNPEEPMKIKKKATATVDAIAPKGFGVMQFEFSKEKFADIAAVQKWMDAGGYTDYEITETGNGFEVGDDAGRFETGSVRKIDAPVEGLTVFVGKLSAEALIEEIDEPEAEGDDATTTESDDAAEGDVPEAEAAGDVDPPKRTRTAPPAEPEADAPAEGDDAPAAKADDAAEETAEAEKGKGGKKGGKDYKKKKDDQQVSEAPTGDGADDAPAQPDEPSDADRARSMVEEIEAKRTKGVYEAAELGKIVNQLGWIVYEADYSGMSDTTVSQIKSAALALLEAFRQAAVDAADELSEVFRSEAEREAVTTERSANPPAPATETVDIAALIETAVAKAVAPFREEAIEAKARAEKAEAELAERVEADNSRGQTRKGADTPDPEVSTQEQAGEKKRSRASNNILASFGSRHAE